MLLRMCGGDGADVVVVMRGGVMWCCGCGAAVLWMCGVVVFPVSAAK
jgi:hypothetical protein